MQFRRITLVALLLATISISSVYAVSTVTRTIPMTLTITASANVQVFDSSGNNPLTTYDWGERIRGNLFLLYIRVKNIGDMPLRITYTVQNLMAGLTVKVEAKGGSGWQDINTVNWTLAPGEELGSAPDYARVYLLIDQTATLGQTQFNLLIQGNP